MIWMAWYRSSASFRWEYRLSASITRTVSTWYVHRSFAKISHVLIYLGILVLDVGGRSGEYYFNGRGQGHVPPSILGGTDACV
jgi:hypothetical protein